MGDLTWKALLSAMRGEHLTYETYRHQKLESQNGYRIVQVSGDLTSVPALKHSQEEGMGRL